jgi:hypothetical protein
MAALGRTAQAAAKKIVEFVSDQLNSSVTGSVSTQRTAQPAGAGHTASPNTLTPADLAPAWRRPGRSGGA